MRKTKGKKVFFIAIAIIILVSFSLVIYGANNIVNPTSITFKDSNLYDSMKKQLSAKKLNYNANDVEKTIEISKNDISKITELDLSSSAIADLSGLENFQDISTLNLSKNSVTSADSLDQLSKITSLNVAENQINTNLLSAISNLSSLTQLDMTNTKMNSDQLEYLKTLTNLKTLILAGNNISAIEKISNLNGITKLDISVNTSFTDFLQLVSFTNLTELNVSGTGITTFSGSEEGTGIGRLSKLEKLYASDNKGIVSSSGIDAIFETHSEYTDNGYENIPYLSNLKFLNLSSIGTLGNRPNISFYSFKELKSLKELHLASNEINSIYGVADLTGLDVLDLKDNNISDIEYLVNKNGNEIDVENSLRAGKIDLNGNKIVDISVFSEYPGDLYWLDLSNNSIYDIEPLSKYGFSSSNDNGKELFLENENITFGLYDKSIDVDHYIIMPTIFRYSMDSSKFAYFSGTEFEYSDGVRKNTDYTEPEEYNVIVNHEKTMEDDLTVTIRGGITDGSTLHFKIGEYGDTNCYIESVYFKDSQLYSKIEGVVTAKVAERNLKYHITVPLIINVDRDAISSIDELNLQHTDSSSDTKIKDLTGLENFGNLQTLYLQNNDVSTIEQFYACESLRILNLASNSNINNNNKSIVNLRNLETLNLSNTGLTNIDFLNELYETGYCKLVVLDISDNPKLNNIEGIEKITTLQSLGLSNTNLDDNKTSKLNVLTNLTTLNINGNQIKNIDIVSNLKLLKYFYFNNNKIESLEPLKGKTFYELEFTGNNIKNISALSSHRTINNLKMDNNQIEDVSVLSRISMSNEQNLSVNGQKIVRLLDKSSSGKVNIVLPQIFLASQQSGNKIYSSNELSLTNCELDSTGQNVIVDADKLNGEVAQVEIVSGKAKGTVLTISAPLNAIITYEPSNTEKTNQNVIARISFNQSRREIKITNNDGKDTYTFEQNGEFTFTYVDQYRVEGSATAIVQNIDKKAPVAQVSQVQKNEQVEVTITVNEKVADVEGWTSQQLTNGSMTLTKVYSQDTTEDVKLEDEAGNVTTINVKVQIKRISDVLTSNTLKISETDLNIKKVYPKTTVLNFKKSINSEMEYTILNKSGTELSDSSYIGTGCQVKMKNDKVYTVIVWGDLTGNGKISLTELARISKIFAEQSTSTDLEKSAIDINMNGKLDLVELAAIARLQLK